MAVSSTEYVLAVCELLITYNSTFRHVSICLLAIIVLRLWGACIVRDADSSNILVCCCIRAGNSVYVDVMTRSYFALDSFFALSSVMHILQNPIANIAVDCDFCHTVL